MEDIAVERMLDEKDTIIMDAKDEARRLCDSGKKASTIYQWVIGILVAVLMFISGYLSATQQYQERVVTLEQRQLSNIDRVKLLEINYTAVEAAFTKIQIQLAQITTVLGVKAPK